MRLEKNALLVTRQEGGMLSNRLKGMPPPGYVPDDPDWPTHPSDPATPDLYACAAAYLENGGSIEGCLTKERAEAAPPLVIDYPPREKKVEPSGADPAQTRTGTAPRARAHVKEVAPSPKKADKS